MALSLEYVSYIVGNVLKLTQSEWRWLWLVDIVETHFVFLAQFLSILIATQWGNHRMRSIMDRNKFDLLPLEDSRMPLIAVRSKTVTVLSSSNPVNRVSLIEILSNHRSFDVFIKHLMAEFCIEVLLSLVELVQAHSSNTVSYIYNKISKGFFPRSLRRIRTAVGLGFQWTNGAQVVLRSA